MSEYEHEVQSDITDNRTLAIITKAEIDQQITTAKAYPRSVSKFIAEAKDLVMLSEDIAKECIYVLTRKDKDGRKTIEGPSSRLAEIVMSCWGNNRGGARIVTEERDFVVSQGVFHDLERNVSITYETKRRIVTSDGRRYGVDMIGVTGNAACSIALRNAVFKGIPKAFWQPIYDAAKSTALGNEQTIKGRREKALAYWQSQGISNEKVFKYLGVAGIEDIGLPELMVLIGLVTAIKEGDTTAEQAFSDPDLQPGQTKETKDLNDAIAKKAKPAEKAKPAQGPVEQIRDQVIAAGGVASIGPEGIDFDLEQPTHTVTETDMQISDIRSAISGLEGKVKKAKSAKQWSEINDKALETLDLMNDIKMDQAVYLELAGILNGYIGQAEKELGA